MYKRSVKFDPLGPKGSDGKVESCLSVYKNLGSYFCVMIKCLLFSSLVSLHFERACMSLEGRVVLKKIILVNLYLNTGIIS